MLLLDCRHAAHVISLAASSFLGILAAAAVALALDTWDKSEAVYVCVEGNHHHVCSSQDNHR